MGDEFANVYNDETRAKSYAKLDFPGTYYLAFRDLPEIVNKHVTGSRALDFGCGTGRSSRFCQRLGFNVTGIDISPQMLDQARELDPHGDYRLVDDGNLESLADERFDLVLAAFTFDNIDTPTKKITLFQSIRNLLTPNGRMINLVSSPDIYINEWSSFSTKDFPKNASAKDGDRVQIVMLDVDDRRPVEDILWGDDAYARTFASAELIAEEVYRPLGRSTDPCQWVSEMRIAPWVIYVLRAKPE